MCYVIRNGLSDERAPSNVSKEAIYSVMDKYALTFVIQSSGYGSLFMNIMSLLLVLRFGRPMSE